MGLTGAGAPPTVATMQPPGNAPSDVHKPPQSADNTAATGTGPPPQHPGQHGMYSPLPGPVHWPVVPSHAPKYWLNIVCIVGLPAANL